MTCCKTAVYQSIARFQNFGLYHDKKRSEGQEKTSSRDVNLLRRIAVRSPISSCKKIHSALFLKGKDVHRTTVSRLLVHDFYLKAFKLAKKPRLTPVAYAGFSKGGPGNSENLRIMKTRLKIFQPKTKSVFLPKLW